MWDDDADIALATADASATLYAEEVLAGVEEMARGMAHDRSCTTMNVSQQGRFCRPCWCFGVIMLKRTV